MCGEVDENECEGCGGCIAACGDYQARFAIEKLVAFGCVGSGCDEVGD
jgi:ferredoxin